METNSYIEPVYLISAVAEILNIHPQTLRQYEREGLIKPSRTNGKIRLYSQKDIDHIKYVLTLTRELGVNLAGVDMILKLQKKIKKLQDDLNTQFSSLQNQLQDETAQYKEELRSSVGRLASLKNDKSLKTLPLEKQELPKNALPEMSDEEAESKQAWEIEYDQEDR